MSIYFAERQNHRKNVPCEKLQAQKFTNTRFTWKWPYQVPTVVAATSITPNHAMSHMQCESKIIKNSSIACSVKMECEQECVTVPFPISKLFPTTKTFSRKSCYSVLGASKCAMNGVTYFWLNGLIFQFSRFRAIQHDIFIIQIIHIVNCFSWMLVATLDFSVQQKINILFFLLDILLN